MRAVVDSCHPCTRCGSSQHTESGTDVGKGVCETTGSNNSSFQSTTTEGTVNGQSERKFVNCSDCILCHWMSTWICYGNQVGYPTNWSGFMQHVCVGEHPHVWLSPKKIFCQSWISVHQTTTASTQSWCSLNNKQNS